MSRFEIGQVVYWHEQNGNDHSVGWGLVDEVFHDVICINIIEPRENRVIVTPEGKIPIDELPPVTRWYKLPKGWTYNTQLFDIEYAHYDGDDSVIDITNPENILDLYKRGLLVNASTRFHGSLETEISKEGWRIAKKHPAGYDRKTHTSIYPFKCFDNYKNAKADVDAYEAELRRQASLSDYEWSVEEIDKVLNRWAKLYGEPDDIKNRYREWLLSLKDVEDIEVRCSGGAIQWKYWKNKRWNNIEL